MSNNTHMPDVLNCLANLSSDEVFTSPKIVNEMLDLLPQELFENPETTFLDPCTKSRLRSSGLHDKALRDYTFENDKGYNPEMEKAHKYVEQWDKMKAMSTGLLLWGGTGTGKTFFAGCVANALIDTGVPVLMTNFARILNSLTNMFSEDRNGFIDSLNKYELLIIDDLGMERQSEFALEQVYNVIDSRYRSKRPLIVTTNLTLDELKNPADISRKRIYDRVLERCVPLKINNRNIRTMNAAMNFSAAKELLVGGDEQ